MTDVLTGARADSLAEKQRLLQQYVDDWVGGQLGRQRGQPKPEAQRLSAWSCSRCGSRHAGDLNYSGSYRRTMLLEEGSVALRIPRVRCRCEGKMAPDFGAVLPKRQRLWYDVTRMALALHVEGLSYRAVSRMLARQGAGQPVAWHRTGKVSCCAVAPAESQAGWEAALGLHLPWANQQRCVWHIGHRTRAKVARGHEDRFERDTRWVFKAPDVTTAADRLLTLAQRWQADETEAGSSVRDKSALGVQYLRRDLPGPLRPRTVGISERYNQEPKRRFKAMRGFGNEQNLVAMTRLIALRHNRLLDRTDGLAHALNTTWTTPVPAAAARQRQRQQQRPVQPSYTIGGT